MLLVTFSHRLQSHLARCCALSLCSALALGDDERGEPGRVPFYVASSVFAFGSHGTALMLEDLGIVRWGTPCPSPNRAVSDLCPFSAVMVHVVADV